MRVAVKTQLWGSVLSFLHVDLGGWSSGLQAWQQDLDPLAIMTAHFVISETGFLTGLDSVRQLGKLVSEPQGSPGLCFPGGRDCKHRSQVLPCSL